MTHSTFWRTPAPLWLGMLLMLIVAISVMLPVQPNDFWWYVRLGSDIIQTKSIPAVDHYTYTQNGQPFVYHSWLAALVFWAEYQFGGIGAVVFLRGLLLALFYGAIWQSTRLAGVDYRLATGLTLLAALVGSNNWAMRPQLFSYPLFGLALLALWQWRNGKNRWVWLLPGLTLVWVNLHGAFVLIFLLAGAAWVGTTNNENGDRRPLALALVAMFIASLLNPRGVGVWAYVFTLLQDPASQQLGAEWQSPDTNRWQGVLFFLWLLTFPLLTAFSPTKPRRIDWLWYLGFGWMALTGLRYVVWFTAVFATVQAPLWASFPQRWFKPPRRVNIPAWFNIGVLIILSAVPLLLLPGVRDRWQPGAPPVYTTDTPQAATAWLHAHPELDGHLWADLAASSYLIYHLPSYPVWIDTRFELFPVAQWDDYKAISKAQFGWENRLAVDNVNVLLLSKGSQAPLIEAVQAVNDWRQVYADDTHFIFARVK